MRRVLLGAIFVALLLLDLTAVSQTLSLIGLATVFGLVGHGAMWVTGGDHRRGIDCGPDLADPPHLAWVALRPR